jgi:hypothetical protein
MNRSPASIRFDLPGVIVLGVVTALLTTIAMVGIDRRDLRG